MQCAKPVLIRTTDKSLVREGRLVDGLYVPCGKCMACRVARTREWVVRLTHEMDEWRYTSFVTLTYDTEHVPLAGSLEKSDLQKYIKRVRKELGDGVPLKYYACGEYGETYGRPHYHIIFYGLGLGGKHQRIIKDHWTMGLVHIGSVTHDSIQYVAGYVRKKLSGVKAEEEYVNQNKIAPFQVQSKGLGGKYVEKYGEEIKESLSIKMRGVEVGIPRYYKKKLNLDHVQLAPLAKKRDNEVEAHYMAKGINTENDLAIAVGAARKQHNENVKARIALKKTGTL